MASVNLAAALDIATQAVAGALATIGTTVTITRSSPVVTVNLDTLVPTAPAETVLFAAIDAIVAYPNQGSRLEVYPGATQIQEPNWPITLPPQVVDIRRGDRITVNTSRDARLIGKVFEITVVIGTSAGAARQVLASSVPQAGQT